MNQPAGPLAFHIMTKPIGPICNLDCRYCFYLQKEDLYPGNRRWAMSDEVLERYIRDYIAAQEVPEVNFAWQGGEPTLLGVRFFRKAVELQKRHARGKRISNAIQTNGTLLDDEWCRFLHDNDFLVGLSLDGPRDLHDAYRRDKRDRPSFDRVMRGLELMQKHRVEFNTLTVVNRLNAHHPLEVYRFLKQAGSRFLQFIPLVERMPPEAVAEPAPSGHALAGPPDLDDDTRAPRVTEWSVEAEQFGVFLCAIYDEWVRNDVARVFVQIFDTALGIWAGAGASLCVFAETCGRGLAIEHNGDLYACDHYVYPEHRLGNVMEVGIKDMVLSRQQLAFGEAKRDTLPAYCRSCEVLFACRGECPKHRFVRTPDGEPGLNYLCPSYKRFFKHIDRDMRLMTQLLQANRAPAEIMSMYAHARAPHVVGPSQNAAVVRHAPGRNDPCPCGSGRKFKQCCLNRL
ncbi:MAG: anaerobic sulfatase maturase [Chthonomonadales bacterium]|nr:anaerobic sulfatase maturase [Chthonomonadales bacterium]